MSLQSICALALFAQVFSDEGDGAGACSDEATLLQSVSRQKIQSHQNQPHQLAAVQNENENCWNHCNRRGGLCDFCGTQGACCRQQGWDSDPWECGGLGGGIDGPHHSCRLALNPATEAAAFVYGEHGSNVCPTRDVSEEACLAAVQSLLPSDVTQGRAQLVAGSWGWVPPGCSVQSHFTHNQPGDWAAHYNRNPNGNNDDGYTPVCQNGYAFGEVASNECRDGDVDEAECLAAAQSLLPLGVNQGRTHLVAGSWGWVPPGCSVQSHFTHNVFGDWAAHYNRNPNGNNDDGYTPVCMRTPSGEAEYIGCFVDDGSRDLGAMVGNTGASTNSFARCRDRCGDSIYMSLQYGGECFCADAYGTAPQYVMVDDARCDSSRVPCSLNSHNCGGTWHQAIYVINPQCGGVYQAEDATLDGAVVHGNTASPGHQGFTGRSFVDYLRTDGSAEWNIEHCGAGAASVSFRYALRGQDRPLQVELNGEVVHAQLSFPPTGSWATWGRTNEVQIPLVAGANTIRLVGTGRSGANVDSMTLTTGTCADQGRYIRHDVGTAIYWEHCGVKYWVPSCTMCDDTLDFAHTPCHNHWVDQPQSYIDSLLTGGGFPGADGDGFQCSQHWAYSQ